MSDAYKQQKQFPEIEHYACLYDTQPPDSYIGCVRRANGPHAFKADTILIRAGGGLWGVPQYGLRYQLDLNCFSLFLPYHPTRLPPTFRRYNLPTFLMIGVMKITSKMTHPTSVHPRRWMGCLAPCNRNPGLIEAMLWLQCSFFVLDTYRMCIHLYGWMHIGRSSIPLSMRDTRNSPIA